jgi:hypothetical protein
MPPNTLPGVSGGVVSHATIETHDHSSRGASWEPTLVDRLSGVDQVRVPGADALRALAAHPAIRAMGAPTVVSVAYECVVAAYTYLLVRPVAHIYLNAPGTENWGMWFGAPPADMCARMTGSVSTAADWAANPAGCHAMIQRRFNGFLTVIHTALALLVAVRVWRVLYAAPWAVFRAFGCVMGWVAGTVGFTTPPPSSCPICQHTHAKTKGGMDREQ